MTATEEPTLYDVLEVDPASSLDELRAAVERARETYGPESLAVYALVDEEQIEELRAKLDEAAAVLLDPVRRASYDRSIGRIGPSTLWAEDDDDEEAPLPPVAPGPHARSADLQLETVPEDEAEEPVAPRQHALDLELTDTPGPFGQGPERPEAALGTDATAPVGPSPAAPLLSGDWAAAVPAERQVSRASTEPDRAVVTAPA
ncbi:MAG: J domain-containing protein, partial [Myxococcaceae bacterium]